MKINFGIPKHGWLPFSLNYEDYQLNIEVSNVPFDPIVQLCDALIQINKGIRNSNYITLHLEPYCYYLQILKVDEVYKLVLSESEKLNTSKKIVKEITGSFEEIILQLYRSLKQFNSLTYHKNDWKKLDKKRVNELTILIKERKHCK